MGSTLRKVDLYILSLGLLFVFIIIITFELPKTLADVTSRAGLLKTVAANYVSVIAAALLLYCVYAYLRFGFELKGATNIPFEVKRIEGVDYEHLTFLATYVVPLISFDFESSRQMLVLLMLLIAMGAIYIKTDLFYANPSLALFGFRIYRVDGHFKDGDRNGIIVICRSKLSVGARVAYIKLDERIYFAKGRG